MNTMSARNLPQLLADAQAAAQRASIATRSWPAFMPSTPAVDELANTVEGLRRTLCELRPHTLTLRSEA
jgi:hypothetical protein